MIWRGLDLKRLRYIDIERDGAKQQQITERIWLRNASSKLPLVAVSFIRKPKLLTLLMFFNLRPETKY